MDDNKKSTTIWLRPSVISRMDGWLEADNCQSRSEFVDNLGFVLSLLLILKGAGCVEFKKHFSFSISPYE